MKPDTKKPPLTFDNSDGFGYFSTGQFGEDLIINNIFRDTHNGFYIDVGAFHPKRYSNTYLLREYKGWSGINIDANPDIIANFNASVKSDININAAISDCEEDVKLTLYKGKAFSTISDERRKEVEGIEIDREITVKTVTLKEIINRHKPQGLEIDYINIDVEGVDLRVLKSIDLNHTRPRVISIEDHEFSDCVNKKSSSKILNYLNEHNYKLYAHNVITSIYVRN